MFFFPTLIFISVLSAYILRDKSLEVYISSLIFIPFDFINLLVSLLLLLKLSFSNASKIENFELVMKDDFISKEGNLSSSLFILNKLFEISAASFAAMSS